MRKKKSKRIWNEKGIEKRRWSIGGRGERDFFASLEKEPLTIIKKKPALLL
jgi:hypothetical protein